MKTLLSLLEDAKVVDVTKRAYDTCGETTAWISIESMSNPHTIACSIEIPWSALDEYDLGEYEVDQNQIAIIVDEGQDLTPAGTVS